MINVDLVATILFTTGNSIWRSQYVVNKPLCLLTGEESNLAKLGNGAGKTNNAQQKRQDYKSAKPGPQSLEFTVKKPVPIVQEPKGDMTTPKSASEEQQRTFQDLLDQKKVLDLLEVPSRFQNPNRKTTDNVEETAEKPACLSSPSSTDTLTDHSGTEEDVATSSGTQTEVVETHRKEEEEEEEKPENSGSEDVAHETISTSSPDQPIGSPHGVSVGTDDAHYTSTATSPQPPSPPTLVSLLPKTAPQNLNASYVNRRKGSKNMVAASSSVATFVREKNEPQLMSIRKIESFAEGGVCSSYCMMVMG